MTKPPTSLNDELLCVTIAKMENAATADDEPYVMTELDRQWSADDGPEDAGFYDAIAADTESMHTLWEPSERGSRARLECLYAGWQAGAAKLERVRAAYEEARRERAEARSACQDVTAGPWIWADDHDENDLASMSEGMIVTMTAGQLRALLAREQRNARTTELIRWATIELHEGNWIDVRLMMEYAHKAIEDGKRIPLPPTCRDSGDPDCVIDGSIT